MFGFSQRKLILQNYLLLTKMQNTVRTQMDEFGLGKVIDEVIPYGCIMAGDWKKNAPWKKRRRNKK